jgi:hypothetical protein
MKSAFSEDFIELQVRYHNATIEERNRLWPDFIRAIRVAAPGFIEEFDRAFRSGDYLMAMFEQCMKRTFDRPELDAGRKTTALEDTSVFLTVFDELKRDDLSVEEMRKLAYDLGARALLAGARSGLSLTEIEDLHAKYMFDRQRRLANEPKKDKPNVAHSKELTCEIANENSELSAIEIAEEILNRWRIATLACPEHDRLVWLVRKWRRGGVIPLQTGPRRRRRYPLRRVSSKLKFPNP